MKIGNPSKSRFEIVDARPLKVGAEYSLSVDCDEDAGHGDVTCVVKGPCGNELPVMIIDTGARSKRIHFKPKHPGMHEVNVCFAGAPLAGSPYMIEVLGAVDPSKVLASGDGIHQGMHFSFEFARRTCCPRKIARKVCKIAKIRL